MGGSSQELKRYCAPENTVKISRVLVQAQSRRWAPTATAGALLPAYCMSAPFAPMHSRVRGDLDFCSSVAYNFISNIRKGSSFEDLDLRIVIAGDYRSATEYPDYTTPHVKNAASCIQNTAAHMQ